MNCLAAIVQSQGFCVLDGGMGSQLEREGVDCATRLWSAEALLKHPDKVKAIHRGYLESGANVITTCSYQLSEEGFEEAGYGRDVARAMARQSVRLAVEARNEFMDARSIRGTERGKKYLVAASLGCYGAYLANGAEYTGDYGAVTVDHLVDFHQRRIHALMGEYNDGVGSTEPPLPDLLAFETVPNLCELRAIVKILRMPSSPCYRNQPPPAWISFACRDDMHLTSGELLDDALAIIDQANFNDSVLCAVGVNCMPPQFAPALVARIHAQLPGMLTLCYPNRGEEWDAKQRVWRPLTGVGGACEFARVLVECRRRGGRVLGGCCRTSYEDISVARRELSNDTLRETHASTTFHS